MELTEFREEILEEAKTAAEVDGDGATAAFVAGVTGRLIEAEVLPSFDPAFFSGSGARNRRLRLDGYAFDELDNSLALVVADFTGNINATRITRSETEQLFQLAERILDEAFNRQLQSRVEISTPIADLVETLLTQRARIAKYRVLVLTDRTMSERIERFEDGAFEGTPVEYQLWDMDRLFKAMQADIGREAIEIDFAAMHPNGLPCLEASTSEYHSYLCVLPATLLADIYDRYGAQLLEGNVRSFLSTKVAVNKNIRQTILQKPERFFAFNNGISATCTAIEIDKDGGGGARVTRAKDFQVINGGQTTASLSNARFRDKAELASISVAMKLTEVHGSQDDAHDFMASISRSANSQNKVSEADFFSTHPFHVRMEQFSRHVFAPAVGGAQHGTHWFYERARGQFTQEQMRMTKGERARFMLQNPKEQVMTKLDFAKVRNAWMCKPHVVSKGAQASFVEFAEWVDQRWQADGTEFNERYFQETVALVIFFRHLEKLVSRQSWYEHGYRANIVAYSLALVSYLISQQFGGSVLDLGAMWLRQDVGPVLSEQACMVAEQVLQAITAPDRPVANVTQWCKQEACWNDVKKRGITLGPSVRALLLSRDEATETGREAREDQRMVTGIQAQVLVAELGSDYWRRFAAFVRSKGLATDSDVQALRIAAQMPARIPQEWQAQRLIALIDRAAPEGWKEVPAKLG